MTDAARHYAIREVIIGQVPQMERLPTILNAIIAAVEAGLDWQPPPAPPKPCPGCGGSEPRRTQCSNCTNSTWYRGPYGEWDKCSHCGHVVPV